MGDDTKVVRAHHRQQIFQTRATWSSKLCSLIIDTGSCTDVISSDAGRRLGCKVGAHFKPCNVAWIDDMRLRVREQCSVSIGNINERLNRHEDGRLKFIS